MKSILVKGTFVFPFVFVFVCFCFFRFLFVLQSLNCSLLSESKAKFRNVRRGSRSTDILISYLPYLNSEIID